MSIEFRKVTDFERGTIFQLLSDAYSYDERNGVCWSADWKEFDDFFYDNPKIANQYGFITVLDGQPIGMISWDPRNMPEYVEVGHNCIMCQYKGNGYGRIQLQEALNRINKNAVKRIIVTTNATFLPAQRNYESVGFTMIKRRENQGAAAYSGDYIDYEIVN